jgi:hypothetical protein
MAIAPLILYALALLSPQEPGGQETPPVVEVPGEPRVEPKPAFPWNDGLTIRTIALRPTYEITTREFDINTFSGGELDIGDIADFDRTAMALDLRWDTGSFAFMATYFRMEGTSTLLQDTTFEQHTFDAGTEVEGVTEYGTVEAYYRIDLAGSPADSLHVSMLAGLLYTRYFLSLSGDTRTGSEGFSALWPVPALGLESRFWLSSRIAISLSARATRLAFENPFQIDGGDAQRLKFLSGRLDAGLNWTISGAFSLSAGYSGFSTSIDNSSVEDTDSADLRASGVHFGLTYRY